MSLPPQVDPNSPVPASVLRSLGDRSYDKRKTAAVEIENVTKSLVDSQAEDATERVVAVITLLRSEFTCSTNSHQRKGGLIGLAAVAIGLMHETPKHLALLLPPVLHCFDDPESRVRYYACESLYNICKVARGHVLAYFNSLFDGLCKLFADVDVDVKNGAQLLDRLVKDIVTESETFDVNSFIPLLQKYLRMTNPYIRQLLVGWITALDSVPDIDMLERLPEFLDGLFNMLSDGNREIRQAADQALADFLREIKQATAVEFSPMVHILVPQCNSAQKFNRLTAVTWVHEFIHLGGEQLVGLYAELLGAMLHCISDPESEIRQVAEAADEGLLELVQSTSEPVELGPLLEVVTLELLNQYVPTRTASLRWISMLLDKLPSEMLVHIDELFPALLKTLSDPNDDVVLMDLEVLARIARNTEQFRRVLSDVVRLFGADRALLESRGSVVIRKLCVLLRPDKIYPILASILRAEEDLEFASLMVQTLNLILLTASELGELRAALKRSWCRQGSQRPKPEDRELFTTLYQSWCHNPVATLSLCLLAQAYQLASHLVVKFAEIEVTVGFLMEIDKLVQLLESPIFMHLRLQLLQSGGEFQPALFKALYGILMLLPQSSAFSTLQDRLGAVSSLHLALGTGHAAALSSGSKGSGTPVLEQQDTQLLRHFVDVQHTHAAARHKALMARSLLDSSNQK